MMTMTNKQDFTFSNDEITIYFSKFISRMKDDFSCFSLPKLVEEIEHDISGGNNRKCILWNVWKNEKNIEIYVFLNIPIHRDKFSNEDLKQPIYKGVVNEWLIREPETLEFETVARAPLDLVPQSLRELVITIGGWSATGPSNDIFVYDVVDDHWLHGEGLKRLSGYRSLAYHGLTRIDNDLYIVGGTEAGIDSSRRCYRIDLDNFTCGTIDSLAEPRMYVNCLALDGLVYAIGGSETENHRHRTGEVYDATRNEWTILPRAMKQPRSDAGGASLNGKLYIIGGYTGSQVLSDGECYDVAMRKWSTLPNMNTPRSGVCCVALNGHIYAIGGFNGEFHLNSMERYDPETRQWHMLSPMLVVRSNMTAVVIRNKYIVVIGGYSTQYSVTDAVELYDVAENTWYTRAPIPKPLSALKAVTLNASTDVMNLILGERDTLPLTPPAA